MSGATSGSSSWSSVFPAANLRNPDRALAGRTGTIVDKDDVMDNRIVDAVPPVVTVIDDDEMVSRALARLVRCHGYEVRTFRRAEEFLNTLATPSRAGCLIVDHQMPGISGLELQRRLESQRDVTPILFLTGHADVPMSIAAMKAGAIDLLLKPVSEAVLLPALARAIEVSRAGIAARQQRLGNEGFLARWATLTPREADVCLLVTRGLLNKQIAGELAISEKTVKTHRGRVMSKLAVGSVAELVKFTERTACLENR
jgi:FixJ family two-component response regulator